MPQPVTLTFPPGFDPFAGSEVEVAETVRRLWVEAADRDLAEAVADAWPEDHDPIGMEAMADVPGADIDLGALDNETFDDPPTAVLTPAQQEEMRAAAARYLKSLGDAPL